MPMEDTSMSQPGEEEMQSPEQPADNYSYEEPEIEGPSVLDYLKARLTPWRGPAPEIPELEAAEVFGEVGGVALTEAAAIVPAPELEFEALADDLVEITPMVRVAGRGRVQPYEAPKALPWKIFIVFMVGGLAQVTLNPDDRNALVGSILYLLAAAWVVYVYWRGEIAFPLPEVLQKRIDPLTFRWVFIGLGVLVSATAFWLFGGNLFNILNVFIWLVAFSLIVYGLWQPEGRSGERWQRFKTFISARSWYIQIPRGTLLVAAAIVLILFFRYYRLGDVVPEMVSDHAEKLQDVYDVLQGITRIYFPRNTGREAMQFYLIALTAKIFKTGISFISMKIGTATFGVLMLIYVYKLGAEIGNKWVGFLAAILMGVAYWPNVLARVALRFVLYPTFVAPTLYYLVRGLRSGRRNDFILAGIALGIGLHGYTPIRFLPFTVVAAVGIYLLHRQSKEVRRQTIVGLAIIALVSLVIFLPLARYWSEHPDVFGFRAFSRLGSVERPLPGPAWKIFLSNLGNAQAMVNWSGGNIWVVSIPNYPAVDLITGVFFVLGVVLLLARYVRYRYWLDLFLLIAYPLLMMPSILSLAFPDENPALNRAGGAAVIVFLVAALALEGSLRGIKEMLAGRLGRTVAGSMGVLTLMLIVLANYNLTFVRYAENFSAGAWNTSEMGAVIENFAETVGGPDQAWVVAYPHWVDNRLVGINAGQPTRDYSIWPEQLEETLPVSGPKLFLFKPDDEEAQTRLKEIYPKGALSIYDSEYENKDFYMYFVPAEE
ncbi:MAG: glycosyltransferase family 39 protein [Anaerolineales bacterium]|nr:glycosyltransferase family 39 protein [Anaerolineales bacterium]